MIETWNRVTCLLISQWSFETKKRVDEENEIEIHSIELLFKFWFSCFQIYFFTNQFLFSMNEILCLWINYYSMIIVFCLNNVAHDVAMKHKHFYFLWITSFIALSWRSINYCCFENFDWRFCDRKHLLFFSWYHHDTLIVVEIESHMLMLRNRFLSSLCSFSSSSTSLSRLICFFLFLFLVKIRFENNRHVLIWMIIWCCRCVRRFRRDFVFACSFSIDSCQRKCELCS